MITWVVWHWVPKGGSMEVAVVGQVQAADKRGAEHRAATRYGGGYQVQSKISFDLSREEAEVVRRNESKGFRRGPMRRES